MDTSKLGLDPGATTMAGKGVVSVMAAAAVVPGAPASNARPSIDVTRPSLVARNRAFRPTDTESPPRTVHRGELGYCRDPGARRCAGPDGGEFDATMVEESTKTG